MPDTEYAELTLAMRSGDDPGAVFDALLARGQDPPAPRPRGAAGGARRDRRRVLRPAEQVAVVVDTREQAAELNAAIRERLVADGRVDDIRVAVTEAGQRIGAGDRIATRRNDRDLGVANRDTWTVTACRPARPAHRHPGRRERHPGRCHPVRLQGAGAARRLRHRARGAGLRQHRARRAG